MKLLFAYDVAIEHDRATNSFYHNYFDYELWRRYLEVFQHVEVASRQLHRTATDTLLNQKRSSGQGVSFCEVPSLSNPVALLTKRADAIRILSHSLSQADVLIARLPSEVGAVAIQTAHKLGKPWAVEVVGHAWDALWNYGTWQGKIYAPIMTWRTKRLVQRAPYALYVTNQFLQRHYPCKGHTIGCSDVFIPMMDDAGWERRLERIGGRHRSYDTSEMQSMQPIRIGLIGSMAARYKGIDTALHALAILHRERGIDSVPIQLRVLGEGDSSPWIALSQKLGVESQVEFCPPVPSGAAVFNWLDDLDIYVQPSYQEGLPRALIEAMSRGLPAIGSTAGGIPELLAPEWIFPAGNAQLLAAALRRMIRNEATRLRVGECNFIAAKQYAKEKLDARRTAFLRDFCSFAMGSALSPRISLT
ncbi:glycosyltransferase family 4 protein [Paenibacillus sp. 481]|uniref:glycosyltransferase family 4 protein n=1 Tax=Paenibacillus sp. 481 TaxID=2835869 RepID=UPI001E32140C|nr:glycosyltransferase family 4 protein [Paenibacillus sp. 481]UHA71965.1 glycosyltransferase family 4 protein [Paenibacillus sp. 481]